MKRKPDLMQRTRAARCFTNATNDDGTELGAFMALFHPEFPEDKTRELVNDARSRQRGARR
jgi:hypothetical protein